MKHNFQIVNVVGLVKWEAAGKKAVTAILKLQRENSLGDVIGHIDLADFAKKSGRVNLNFDPSKNPKSNLWNAGASGECISLYLHFTTEDDSALVFKKMNVSVIVQELGDLALAGPRAALRAIPH